MMIRVKVMILSRYRPVPSVTVKNVTDRYIWCFEHIFKVL